MQRKALYRLEAAFNDERFGIRDLLMSPDERDISLGIAPSGFFT